MAEIYPHIEVALTQAKRENQNALSTLTALQTQLSLNQSKIASLVAELQNTQKQAENYSRAIPQVERVRLRTDQKLRQLREHADRVARELAAERRVQTYLEELQHDDEYGERRLKEYVSEVMRKDAEGYDGSDSESEWSVLDQSIDSLKNTRDPRVQHGSSTPMGGNTSQALGVDTSDAPADPHSQDCSVSPAVSAVSILESSAENISVSKVSNGSWTSGGAKASSPDASTIPSTATSEDNLRSPPRDTDALVDDHSDTEERHIQEIEETHPALLPVVANGSAKAGAPGEPGPEPVLVSLQHSTEYSTPRQEAAALVNQPEVRLAESLVIEPASRDVEEEVVAEQQEEPEASHYPRTSGFDASTAPPEPVDVHAETCRPASPIESMKFRDASPSTQVPADVDEEAEPHDPNFAATPVQAVSSSPTRSPDRIHGSPRKHYYPPTSTRSALVQVSQVRSRDESPNAQEPLAPSPFEQSAPVSGQSKYIWSPLPPLPSGSETIRASSSSRSRGRAELPSSYHDAREAPSPSSSSSPRSRYFQDTQSWERYRELATAALSASPARTGDRQYSSSAYHASQYVSPSTRSTARAGVP